MNGETFRRKVTIMNPQGLHIRPASAFAQLAGTFRSHVKVWKDAQGVDGRSPLELLLLAALPGTELIVEVTGDDAETALQALADLLAAPNCEEVPGSS
jgi:phosphocarrier protein